MRARLIVATQAVTGGAVLLAAVAVICAGVFNVAADDAHWGLTRWLLETARLRSIQRHAAGIVVPQGLDDPGKLAIGVKHFAAHCAVCHGAPGVPPGDIARGMDPKPPNLAAVTKTYSDAELFWILKHGIKMTGMPSWGDHSDDELWATVAFLNKLGAGISEADYAKLVMENAMHGMMHHAAGETTPGIGHPAAPPAEDAPHQH